MRNYRINGTMALLNALIMEYGANATVYDICVDLENGGINDCGV